MNKDHYRELTQKDKTALLECLKQHLTSQGVPQGMIKRVIPPSDRNKTWLSNRKLEAYVSTLCSATWVNCHISSNLSRQLVLLGEQVFLSMPLVVSLSMVMPVAEKAQREYRGLRDAEVLNELRGVMPKPITTGFRDKRMTRERLGVDPRLATELLRREDGDY